jgi:hypothetical protein
VKDSTGQWIAVAMSHIEYESSDLISVCSDVEKAKLACEKYEKEQDENSVLDWHVNNYGLNVANGVGSYSYSVQWIQVT